MSDVYSLDAFSRAYLACALWTGTDDDQEPLDANYSEDDFAKEAIVTAAATCKAFKKENAAWLRFAGDDSQNGHDLWLTRNGHGAGFWDRGYSERVSSKLTEASEALGETYVFEVDGQLVIDV